MLFAVCRTHQLIDFKKEIFKLGCIYFICATSVFCYLPIDLENEAKEEKVEILRIKIKFYFTSYIFING